MKKKLFFVMCILCIYTLSGCGDDLDNTITGEQKGAYSKTESSELQPSDMETDDTQLSDMETDDTQPSDVETDDTQPSDIETDDTQPIHITISAVGDVTLGNHHMQEYPLSFRQVYDEAEDAGYFFENVYDVFSKDDMTLANLEGALTLSEEMNGDRTYYIKGDPQYAKILTAGSVEAVSLANNHRMDYGVIGSEDTKKALEEENIVYAYDKKVGIYETKGITIGYVSVNECSQGTAVEKIIKKGIEDLQEQEVDLILVCCHWGIEREYYPEEYQQTLGHLCIDWGADLVIGHHPHVIQGIEEYQGKYIVYSLGNFCFGANRNPSDKDTMIFTQTFSFLDGERLEDTKVRIIPCSLSSTSKRNDFKPTIAVDEEAERIVGRINGFSEQFGVQFDTDGNLVEREGTLWKKEN